MKEMEDKQQKGSEGMDVSSLWTCSDDFIEEEMAIESAKIDFNQARQDAINMTKEWEQASANQTRTGGKEEQWILPIS